MRERVHGRAWHADVCYFSRGLGPGVPCAVHVTCGAWGSTWAHPSRCPTRPTPTRTHASGGPIRGSTFRVYQRVRRSRLLSCLSVDLGAGALPLLARPSPASSRSPPAPQTVRLSTQVKLFWRWELPPAPSWLTRLRVEGRLDGRSSSAARQSPISRPLCEGVRGPLKWQSRSNTVHHGRCIFGVAWPSQPTDGS